MVVVRVGEEVQLFQLAQFASILHSPLPWVIASGLFVGAAISRATIRTRNKANPERAATRKWTLACVLFSFAIILGLMAVFVPGPNRILDLRFATVGGITAGVAFFALRFKKAMGIPVLFLAIMVVLTFGLFLQSIHAFTGETEIGSVRVIGVESDSMRLEVIPRGSESVLLTMKGTQFSPVVKVVIFSDLLVFLGARTWYRFEGMTSFDDNARQQGEVIRFSRASGISERLWQLFEKYDAQIPGVKTAQTELILKKVREFSTYAVMVKNDGGVNIESQPG
jgi:hypothetical protein